MIEHTNPYHPSRKFEDPEEAALWLEQAGFVIDNGTITVPNTKLFVTHDEKELILWLHENDYYTLVSDFDTLDRKKQTSNSYLDLEKYLSTSSSPSMSEVLFKYLGKV